MQQISNNLLAVAKKILARKDPLLAEIVVNWESIVGNKYALSSYPFRITSYISKNNKFTTLHVKTNSSSASVEMSFMQEALVERIAIYLGHKAINKIKFII